jgi:hypothetical protein
VQSVRPAVETRIISLNRKRLELLRDLADVEERKREVLVRAVGRMHREVGGNVAKRNNKIRDPLGRLPKLTPIIETLRAHYRVLNLPGPLKDAQGIARSLALIRHPNRVAVHLEDARRHLLGSRKAEAREAVTRAGVAAAELKRGLTPRQQETYVGFLDVFEALAWRMPGRNAIVEGIGRARSELRDRDGSIDVVHQHLREARSALGAV